MMVECQLIDNEGKPVSSDGSSDSARDRHARIFTLRGLKAPKNINNTVTRQPSNPTVSLGKKTTVQKTVPLPVTSKPVPTISSLEDSEDKNGCLFKEFLKGSKRIKMYYLSKYRIRRIPKIKTGKQRGYGTKWYRKYSKETI
jgi:hypothetical protein